jgi:hypothetical protein
VVNGYDNIILQSNIKRAKKKEEGGGDMIQKYLNYTTASVLEIAQIIRTEDC